MFNSYSLRRCKKILHHAWSCYQKKEKLSKSDSLELENEILALKEAIEKKDKVAANEHAQKLESFCKTRFPKTFLTYVWELLWAFVFALVVATVVRLMWFEFYEIPTGSMRPTFKEQDHLTVTKTAFGINIPLKTEHFYFDPDLVLRSSIVIFTADQMDIRDNDTKYFGIFPAKKRLIKRLIGKPGDTLYFYGGKIYGIDAEGNELKDLLDAPWMQPLEHIPFISFDGGIYSKSPGEIVFNQMNHPIGRLSVTPSGSLFGEVLINGQWVKDDPKAGKSFGDLWGMGNYAMARLLTKEQVQKGSLGELPKEAKEAPFYLELSHHPSFTYPRPRIIQEGNLTAVTLTPEVSIIPVEQKHLDALRENMYTTRFVVKNGRAQRYNFEGQASLPSNPRFSNIPDGTYEFYFGKAYQIGFGGISYLLPPSHPLYSKDNAFLQELFNLGIEMDTNFSPQRKNQLAFPHRYAYFRDGDLYLLGAPIIKKEDEVLKQFTEQETKKEEQSSSSKPYVAFKDAGPPFNEDQTINKELLEQYGLKIPAKSYLVLGDNHAMSGDSRAFGYVPEANLQGAPSWIIWPPGERLGPPPQKPYKIFELPRLIVWGIAGVIFILWYIWHRRKTTITIKK